MKPNRFPLMLALTIVVFAPVALAAQDDRLARRLDAATQAQVTAVLDSARLAGLPLEPLIDRALEGASKNAPGALIVAAVRRLAADFIAARRALGESSAAELEAGASALRAGVAPAGLAQLRQARARQPLTVPLAVLSDLVARGVPADTAVIMVLAIAAASDEQYVAFQRNVERDIAHGAPPIAAAAVRIGSTATDYNRGVAEPGAGPTGQSPPPRKP